MKEILYVSSSLGLGHITRDLAFARELRNQLSDLDIYWLAAEPARSVVSQAGEKIVDEIDLYSNECIKAEAVSKKFGLNLLKYAFGSIKEWLRNAEIIKQILQRKNFDLIIGDEAYEIYIAIILKKLKLNIPYVMMYDFLGLDAMSKNPLDQLGAYFWNRIWSFDYKVFSKKNNLALFIGELDDIPDKRFGLLLSNRREYAKKYYNIIGYILPFDPNEYTDKRIIRKKLGYGEEPLVLCSIGGTSIGKELLELSGKAFAIVKKQISNLHMILICGPRLLAESLSVPQEIEIRQYVPALYEHLAACDLAIVQGGGTTTLELTALKRPFIYFPLDGHSEQEIVIAGRLHRHNAGIRMSFNSTNEKSLAEAIIANINTNVNYKDIPIDGAKIGVKLISKFF
jgi:UDP-N-acetylglucosamine:LPS N-acetylglucosamine transferase